MPPVHPFSILTKIPPPTGIDPALVYLVLVKRTMPSTIPIAQLFKTMDYYGSGVEFQSRQTNMWGKLGFFVLPFLEFHCINSSKLGIEAGNDPKRIPVHERTMHNVTVIWNVHPYFQITVNESLQVISVVTQLGSIY